MFSPQYVFITAHLHVTQIKVITILQKENSEKEHELTESREAMRMLKEKLQVTSEQMMLLQANFVDMEIQWKEEKLRLESRMKDTAEKHETEVGRFIIYKLFAVFLYFLVFY